MFKAWNIIDAALEKNSTGHHYSETRTTTDELVRRGRTPTIFSYRSAPIGRFPGAEVIPTFSLYRYATVSDDPVWSTLESFIIHNRVFDQDLSKIERTLFHGSLALFPTLDGLHLLGALRWLGRFEDHLRPKAAITLFPLMNWSLANINARLLQTVWRECPAPVKNNVALCVREIESANRFEELLGTRPHFLPSPLGPIGRRNDFAAQTASRDGPMTVAYVGGARPERGAMLVPDIVKQCPSAGIDFFIQVKREAELDVDPLLALGERPNVQIHKGMLAEDDYYDVIARSVVLLPYRGAMYGIKSSGVYVEAKFLGAPVIVPSGSWMADEVKALGNGLVFDAFDAASIAECIVRARREIGALRAAAVAVARDYQTQHGADRHVDAVDALFAA